MHQKLEKITSISKKITKILNYFYTKIAVVLFVIVVVAMFAQVFTRYIMNASLTGTEELGRYCFVWMNMLVAGVCISKNSNATVSILNDSLKGKVKQYHSVFLEVMIAIVGVVLLVKGIELVGVASGQVSPALGIPIAAVYLAIPVGSVGIFVNAVNNIFRRWEGKL